MLEEGGGPGSAFLHFLLGFHFFFFSIFADLIANSGFLLLLLRLNVFILSVHLYFCYHNTRGRMHVLC